MVEDKLVAENERLRRENVELRERVDVLEQALEVFGGIVAENRGRVFYATKMGRLERLAARFTRTRAGG